MSKIPAVKLHEAPAARSPHRGQVSSSSNLNEVHPINLLLSPSQGCHSQGLLPLLRVCMALS